MTIKVIGAGFGRTGTKSLQLALEELGFSRCYHMTEVLAHPSDALVWSAASRHEPVRWDELFAGYQATVDWPGCAFYTEFLRQYPEAKVILTVRDPDKWYDSMTQTVYFARRAFPEWTRRFLPRMRRFTQMLDDVVWVGTFQGKFEDRPHALAVFQRHNEEVQRLVLPDRLLVYEVRQGWQPLCAFLGVPVPQGKTFPHVNDTAEFRGRIQTVARVVRIVGYSLAALFLAGLAGLIWLVSRWLS
jgi:hypothetical protein